MIAMIARKNTKILYTLQQQLNSLAPTGQLNTCDLQRCTEGLSQVHIQVHSLICICWQIQMGLGHKNIAQFIYIQIAWYGLAKDTLAFAQLNIFIFNWGKEVSCPVKFRHGIHDIRPTTGDVCVLRGPDGVCVPHLCSVIQLILLKIIHKCNQEGCTCMST